jgi:hypothetical protein
MDSMHTPWGESLSESTLAEGIVFYETGRHGGILLSAERNARMPEYFRRIDRWYEEDCEACKVLLVFADELGDKLKEGAETLRVCEATINDYWPGALRLWKREDGHATRP